MTSLNLGNLSKHAVSANLLHSCSVCAWTTKCLTRYIIARRLPSLTCPVEKRGIVSREGEEKMEHIIITAARRGLGSGPATNNMLVWGSDLIAVWIPADWWHWLFIIAPTILVERKFYISKTPGCPQEKNQVLSVKGGLCKSWQGILLKIVKTALSDRLVKRPTTASYWSSPTSPSWGLL